MTGVDHAAPDADGSSVVALPMYDLPELHGANDQLWRCLSEGLAARGLLDLPGHLDRSDDLFSTWSSPRLLMAQTCGYPLMTRLRGRVRLVLTPSYKAKGCEGPFHRSVVVVRRGHRAEGLSDLQGERLALNAPDSNTGMNLLRAELAPIVQQASFFSCVVHTGSHVASLAAVAEGQADVASIDCVTWALVERLRPSTVKQLKVLAWTSRSPGLPIVTSRLNPRTTFEALRSAMNELVCVPDAAWACADLLLGGFHPLSEPHYLSLGHYEQMAAGLGYPQLV